MSDTRRILWAGLVGNIGGLAVLVPAFDMAEDVLVNGTTVVSTLVENSPLLTLGAAIVVSAVWLAVSDWDVTYVRTASRIAVAYTVGVALLVSLVVGVQLQLQGNLKPFIIAADAVVIGALGGLVLGLRTAQEERATDDAEAQRDRFQALFDNVPNPIVGVEFVGDVPVVRAINPAFTEVFGFDSETIVDDSLSEYIVPPDEELAPVDRPVDRRGDATDEVWDADVVELETVDGRREFIRLTAPVDRGPRRDGYGIYIDVTDQRQRRERLRVLSRTLRHDIRNQLNVIMGVGTVRGQLDEGGRRVVEMALEAADELYGMTEQTRDIERQIAGESDQRLRDLTAIVSQAATEVREEFPAASVEVTGPETVTADVTGAFSTALAAIIRNGVEHNDTESPTVEVTVAEGLGGEYVDVRVADDGPGIDPEAAEIAQGDLRTDETTTHLDGLGLWMARWVVQNCGGELSFASNSPRGTVVTLRVPRSEGPPDAS